MSASSPPPGPAAGRTQPRDAAYWARYERGAPLRVAGVAAGALTLNVDGRQAVGPLQGFGPLWEKTYSARLAGSPVTPAALIATWKAHFPEFWPPGNRFYAPLRGIAPGEVAALDLDLPGPLPLATGVLVLYADDESFTLMTPQGHMLSGWITLSASREGSGCTIAQAQVLMRANDPLYELGLRLGGHRQEDAFWRHTLAALAARFGVDASVEARVVCLDPRCQWSRARNLWYNAALRSAAYCLAAPLRRVRRRSRGQSRS